MIPFAALAMTRKRKWILGLLVLTLVVTVVPYAASRFAAPGRRVEVFKQREARVRSGGTTEVRVGSTIRVACFNIAHGRGQAESNWDGGSRDERAARLRKIARKIRRLDAEVVILNEVDFDASWSHSVNQARFIARDAGYSHWVEQRNFDVRFLVWKWRFGNAVLSRFPIADAKSIPYPALSRWESMVAGHKRGLDCMIEWGDRPIRIVAAHLSHRSEAIRVLSSEAIVKRCKEADIPAIVAGDMNSTPSEYPGSLSDPNGNNAIETFDQSGLLQRYHCPDRDRDWMTFHAADPRIAIDWILIPSDWRFDEYRVEPTEVSDHRCVVADVSP